MSYQHAIVWIDHQHATVIDFSFDDTHVAMVERDGGPRRIHQKSGIPGSGKAEDDPKFFDAVVEALGDAREILVVGPGNAKAAFRKELDRRHPEVAARVVGVESADHPTNGQLLSFARTYFKRIDTLRGDV